MSHIVIQPGEAGASTVARGLLDTAAALGLSSDVVEWSPSKNGFKVPEAVASAYAGNWPAEETPAESQPEVEAEAAAVPVPESWQAEAAAGPRRFTDEEKAAAVAAVFSGRSIASVAEDMGCSATSVSNWVTAAKKAAGTGEEPVNG